MIEAVCSHRIETIRTRMVEKKPINYFEAFILSQNFCENYRPEMREADNEEPLLRRDGVYLYAIKDFNSQ